MLLQILHILNIIVALLLYLNQLPNLFVIIQCEGDVIRVNIEPNPLPTQWRVGFSECQPKRGQVDAYTPQFTTRWYKKSVLRGTHCDVSLIELLERRFHKPGAVLMSVQSDEGEFLLQRKVPKGNNNIAERARSVVKKAS